MCQQYKQLVEKGYSNKCGLCRGNCQRYIIFFAFKSMIILLCIDGEDFLFNDSVVLVFNPDVNRSCFNVTIMNDNVNELRESFFVNITTFELQVQLKPNTTEVIIMDEDCKSISK